MLLELPDDIEVEQLGPVALRGRDGETDLVAFVRSKMRRRQPEKRQNAPAR